MSRITIFLPISRDAHLQKVFHALEMLECDPEAVSLLTYVDGPAKLYVQARNMTEQSRFSGRLSIHRWPPSPVREFDIMGRRLRIAAIRNESKQYIGDCDYVLSTEDDSILVPNTLTKLLRVYSDHPFAGFVSGTQLGRWGLPHVGAWVVDDVYEPKEIKSLMPGEGIQECDAAGWFGCLTKREHYMDHEAKPFDDVLGPDAQWGLELRREGLRNYVDWSLQVEHRTKDGKVLTLSNTKPVGVQFTYKDNRWKQQIVD